MKEWPKVGTKITFRGVRSFWFSNIIRDANDLLEVDKEYTILKLEPLSSWCKIVLEEFPYYIFPLSFFDYENTNS